MPGSLIGPPQVYLLTVRRSPIAQGTCSISCAASGIHLREVSFPSQRYCDAYQNDYGWVTDGASNLEELNLLNEGGDATPEEDEVLELPGKIRSWVPISFESAAVLNAQRSFAQWFADRMHPGQTTRTPSPPYQVRVALHKAKHRAVEEPHPRRCCHGSKGDRFHRLTEGLKKHKAVFRRRVRHDLGIAQRRAAHGSRRSLPERPEVRVAVCNIIAGGVGITLTAGSHVIFQDLDWVPANHLQAGTELTVWAKPTA